VWLGNLESMVSNFHGIRTESEFLGFQGARVMSLGYIRVPWIPLTSGVRLRAVQSARGWWVGLNSIN
jgi:hypothetical protein